VNKTCYFCEKENCKNCKPFCSTFGYAYVICDNCNGFTPNADWIEYERLLEIEKLYGEEYEEYKKQEAKSPEQKQKEALEFKKLFFGKSLLPIDRKRRTITINGKKHKISELTKLKSL
jgi:hypothetical protein